MFGEHGEVRSGSDSAAPITAPVRLMRGRCSAVSGPMRGGRIEAALGRYCCKSPRGTTRPGKFGNNRIRIAGSVNHNSRFDPWARKLFFVPAPKIVLQQYRPKPVIPIRSIPHRQHSLHRFKVSKIALTRPIERVYIPNNGQRVERVGASILCHQPAALRTIGCAKCSGLLRP
jgi:hypothetical protein